MINENSGKVGSKVDMDNNTHDLSLVYLFWLKIAFGAVGGISYYFIQRLLFYVRGFSVEFLLQYIFVTFVFILYSSIIHLLLILVLYLSKKKFRKIFPSKARIWKFSTRFTFLFFTVFFISTSITYYIGF